MSPLSPLCALGAVRLSGCERLSVVSFRAVPALSSQNGVMTSTASTSH